MPSRVCLPFLCCAIVAAYLVGLGNFPLTERSEARYAGVSWEMLISGDYVTPRYNGIKHFHKPPLFYWVTAASMKVFGPGEAAARLPCAVSAVLAIALAFWLARRPSFGCSNAWLVPTFLATAPFFWEMGRIAVTDMLVTLLVLVSLSCAWQILDVGPSWARLLIFWSSLGLNLLNKGPVGPFIVAMVVLPYLWFTGGSWRNFRPSWGLPLAALIALPWYLLVSARNPGLVAYLLKFQTADRIFTTVHKRSGPIWFYLPVLLGGFLPWTVWLAGALRPAWRKARSADRGAPNPDLFLLLWVILPLLFFSLIGSKLPPYVLPIFPALAILTARHLPLLPGGRLLAPAAVFVLAALTALAQARWGFWPRALPFGEDLRLAGIWLLSSALAVLMVARRRPRSLVFGFLVSMLGLIAIAINAFPKLSYLSAQAMAQAIRENAGAPFEVAIYKRYLFGLPYYLGQRVVHVNHARETMFEGESEHRDYLYPDIDAYRPVFGRGDKDRFLIVSVQDYDEVSARIREPLVFQDGNFLVFKRAARPGEP